MECSFKICADATDALVGRVATHRMLLQSVWGLAHVEDVQYLRVHINHLRQKLGPAAPLLRTEPAVGYRLIEETT